MKKELSENIPEELFFLGSQPGSEICHRLRYMNLLWTYGLTTAASDAGRRLLILWNRGQCHGRDESALGKAMLVIQFQQSRNIQTLRAVAHTVMTSRTGKDDLLHHLLCHRQEILHLCLR